MLGDQPRNNRTQNGGTRAEGSNADPQHQAATVRKPFGNHADRRHIAKPGAHADNQPEGKVHSHEIGRPAGQQETRSEQDAANQGNNVRPFFVLHPPADQKAEGKDNDGDGKNIGCLLPAQIEVLLQRRDKQAPAVKRAE